MLAKFRSHIVLKKSGGPWPQTFHHLTWHTRGKKVSEDTGKILIWPRHPEKVFFLQVLFVPWWGELLLHCPAMRVPRGTRGSVNTHTHIHTHTHTANPSLAPLIKFLHPMCDQCLFMCEQLSFAFSDEKSSTDKRTCKHKIMLFISKGIHAQVFWEAQTRFASQRMCA